MSDALDSPGAMELERLSRALASLRMPALARLTKGAASGKTPISIYLTLLEEARLLDISDGLGTAADFQRRFNGYYGVRRNAVWRQQFYRYFEQAKLYDGSPIALFEEVLSKLYGATNRVEASFVSKLEGTLRPTCPIIDSVVRDFLSRHLPELPNPKGLDGAGAFYRWLNRAMDDLSKTSPAVDWFDEFDETFAALPSAFSISNVKKLDFLIWGGTER
ncbi:MAG: hypothetical protein ACOYOB_20200 [Myxococcota bacterium]